MNDLLQNSNLAQAMGRLVADAGEEGQMQQPIEMGDIGAIRSVQTAIFQLAQAAEIGLLR